MKQWWIDLLPEDEAAGWSNLAGPVWLSRAAGEPEFADRFRAFLRGAGMRLRAGNPASVQFEALRHRSFVVARAILGNVSIAWDRSRMSAQRRYMMIFVNGGAVELSGDATAWSSPVHGLCVILPGRCVIEARIHAGTEIVLFSFDRGLVEPLLLVPENLDVVDLQAVELRAAFNYLRTLVEKPRAGMGSSSDDTDFVVTRGIARSLILSMSSARRESSFVRAQRLIQENACDPAFDTGSLARRVGVSLRTLNRDFANNGLRPAEEIQRIRTARAYTLLTNGSDLPISHVADVSGFGSASSLRRAVHSAYGASPRALRAKARGEPDTVSRSDERAASGDSGR